MPNGNNGLTLKELSSLLDKREQDIFGEEQILSLQETALLKRTKQKPLTLKLQSEISRSFGIGGVQREFTLRRRAKSQERKRGFSLFKSLRSDIAERKTIIKKERAALKKKRPVVDLFSFQVNTDIDF